LPRPRPFPAGVAGGGPSDSDWPVSHSSAVLPPLPIETVASPAGLETSIVLVNQTTPSKSSRPRDSQLPGTCISSQSVESAALSGARQSGFVVPNRSAIGSALAGTALRSALYSERNAALCRVAAMNIARLSQRSL